MKCQWTELLPSENHRYAQWRYSSDAVYGVQWIMSKVWLKFADRKNVDGVGKLIVGIPLHCLGAADF